MTAHKPDRPSRQRIALTPVRTPPPFRPLSARYLVSAKAKRHDAADRPLPHFFYASGDRDID